MTASPAPRPASVLDTDLDLDRAIVRQARRLARGDEALADDLAQEGRIGAWQAGRRYDPSRGVPMLAYCLYWSRLRMIGELRRGLGVAEEALDLAEDRGDDGAQVDQVEARLLVEQLVAGLRRSDRVVVEALLDGLPDRDLAEQLRCSRVTALHTRRMVQARLRARADEIRPAVGQHKAAA